MLTKKLVHLAQQLTQSKVQGHIALLSPSDKISNKKNSPFVYCPQQSPKTIILGALFYLIGKYVLQLGTYFNFLSSDRSADMQIWEHLCVQIGALHMLAW